MKNDDDDDDVRGFFLPEALLYNGIRINSVPNRRVFGTRFTSGESFQEKNSGVLSGCEKNNRRGLLDPPPTFCFCLMGCVARHDCAD